MGLPNKLLKLTAAPRRDLRRRASRRFLFRLLFPDAAAA
jgi:hypothetical protein